MRPTIIRYLHSRDIREEYRFDEQFGPGFIYARVELDTEGLSDSQGISEHESDPFDDGLVLIEERSVDGTHFYTYPPRIDLNNHGQKAVQVLAGKPLLVVTLPNYLDLQTP